MVVMTALRSPRKSAAAFGVAAAAAAAVGVSVAAPSAHAATPSPTQKPTVVLVHGAFVDASEWDGVIGHLQHDGYKVVAPANPLRGLASDSAYLRSVLGTIHGPIVLAGHSYGGSVMTEAAAGDAQVKALVYIAAIAPDKGESVASLGAKFPATELNSSLVPAPYPLPGGGAGVELSVRADKFHDAVAADAPQAIADVAADAPQAIADVAAAAQRPAAANIFSDKTTDVAWKTIPSWDLVTTQDHAINPAEQQFMAERAHAHTVEVNSSHAVPQTHPDAVTGIIEQAAQATAR
ncbi:alpha/beta fold hydrolase [Kitasatospora sp. NPDC059571]|uniref:alpha/beta fold hydrolase n=1 Tax=Kitasatospora sp. NPDC059571 TaxID=3346871 RepID=UPI0036AEEF4A